jgi:hypothetical protein
MLRLFFIITLILTANSLPPFLFNNLQIQTNAPEPQQGWSQYSEFFMIKIWLGLNLN